jgi:hypothetical protein
MSRSAPVSLTGARLESAANGRVRASRAPAAAAAAHALSPLAGRARFGRQARDLKPGLINALLSDGSSPLPPIWPTKSNRPHP